MNEYYYELNKIQNKTLYNIEDEYKYLINQYRKKVMSRLENCVEETFLGIPDYKIEEWLEEFFIEEFKTIEKRSFEKLEDLMNEYKNIISRGMEEGREFERLIYEYSEEIKDNLKKHNLDNIEGLIGIFSRQFGNKLTYYLELFKGISGCNIDSKIDDLKYSIKNRMNFIMNEYYEEYNFMIFNQLNKHITEIKETFHEIKKEESIPEEILNEFLEKMIYNDYKLIVSNNKMYIRDLKTLELLELNYKKENDHRFELATKEKDISFNLINGDYIYFNKNKKNIISINDSSFESSNLGMKYNIKITKTPKGYEFKYQEKLIEDITQIEVIISKIREICPKYYVELMQNAEIVQIINESEKIKEENKEILIDTFDDKMKLNPKRKELLKLKLKLLGYDVIEKNDNIYLIDINNKKEYKLEEGKKGFIVRDLGLELDLNLNVALPNQIVTNLTIVTKGKNKLIIKDLRTFVMNLDNEQYSISITEDNIDCISNNLLSKEEIFNKIREFYPFLIEYIEHKEKEINKDERQESIQELKRYKNSLTRYMQMGASLQDLDAITKITR